MRVKGFEAAIIRFMLVVLVASVCTVVLTVGSQKDTYISKEYVKYCEEIGAKYYVQPEFLEAMIEVESAGVPTVTSGDCVGLMQVNKRYHQDRMKKLGVTNLFDPYSNILVGTDLLVELFEQYGDDTAMVLMMYNGTSNAESKAESGNFTEYANKILERSRELEIMHGKVKL